MKTLFSRYIGIDYSGAKTPNDSLKGLRVYSVDINNPRPIEVIPPPSSKKYWSRRGIAYWLVEQLKVDIPTIVGIDHAFSFPIQYFEIHNIKKDWDIFLDDFHLNWPTDQDIYVDFVRDGLVGNGAERTGNARWRRITELRSKNAKSVFHFDVQGSVAKSTHAGIPWLCFIRHHLGKKVHFWPFDGWDVPIGRSVVTEIYPSIWSKSFAKEERTQDQHDAYSVAAWLSSTDKKGHLNHYLNPHMSPLDRQIAEIEGWILGICDFK